MKDGFITVGAGNFAIRAGDPAYNGGAALAALRRGAEQGVKVMVLPRLCLTGATLGDLYRQEALLAAAWDALLRLAANAKSLDLLAVVGLPVRQGGRLYDCAAAIGGGKKRCYGSVPGGRHRPLFLPGLRPAFFPEVAAPSPGLGLSSGLFGTFRTGAWHRAGGRRI